jgi:hypothetical protein
MTEIITIRAIARNVSAEIFVVCSNFLAPKVIDPKFLDPKHVFKAVSALPPAPIPSGSGDAPRIVLTPAAANVFQPGKKRRHRDGYDDGDYTLFKAASASDFLKTHDAITFLGTFNKIEFRSDEEKAWLKHELTSADIKSNFDDLKVLGKGDFKALLKWRSSMREEVIGFLRPADFGHPQLSFSTYIRAGSSRRSQKQLRSSQRQLKSPNQLMRSKKFKTRFVSDAVVIHFFSSLTRPLFL